MKYGGIVDGPFCLVPFLWKPNTRPATSLFFVPLRDTDHYPDRYLRTKYIKSRYAIGQSGWQLVQGCTHANSQPLTSTRFLSQRFRSLYRNGHPQATPKYHLFFTLFPAFGSKRTKPYRLKSMKRNKPSSRSPGRGHPRFMTPEF